MIPYGRQNINQDDLDAVLKTLRSDFLTQGPMVPKFERAVSSYCGVKFAVAVNSATSALHLACLAMDLGAGDIVWTTPITFVASANCAIYCGAMIDFVDIDPHTFNMSPDALEQKLLKAEKAGELPKVIIPVHLGGEPCDMEKIHTLRQKYGFRIIEDASHAIGGRYLGDPIGSCKFSDITVFSFHPVKIITTGEGGMALTNDDNLAAKMERLRSHGITRDPSEMVGVPDGPWYYQQIQLGYNYRMTDIQASLGISQLKRLDNFVEARRAIAVIYEELLRDIPVVTQKCSENSSSSYHLFIVRVPPEFGSRQQIFERFRANGVGVNLHYIPIYRHPYHASLKKYDFSDFPEAEKYYAEAISIPIYPGLKRGDQEFIVEQFTSPLGHQTIF